MALFRDRDLFVNGTSARRTRKSLTGRSVTATDARDHQSVRTAAKRTRSEKTDVAASVILQVSFQMFKREQFQKLVIFRNLAHKVEKPDGESQPVRLLDDLFRKTKATPCIYWLPLSAEQVSYQ